MEHEEALGSQEEKIAETKQLSLTTFTQWLHEIEEQPAWRARADREFDYYDGNQLDSEVMRRARNRGLPPAIEPLIGPTIDAVLGQEAKSRTDWRVRPDSDKAGDDVAEALNHRLNQAERLSGADTACSDAYKSEIIAGLGWVEVAREQDPFAYQYRCTAIHRNEIWHDWLSKPDLSNARYLVRRKWMDIEPATLMFPEQADLIKCAGTGWQGFDFGTMTMDGGTSTGLMSAYANERGWSIEEMQWRDTFNRRVCLFEVWYRDWQRVLVIKSPDGRVVEFDEDNPVHVQAVGMGLVQVSSAVVGKIRLSWWLGPHCLSDEPSPYKHGKFPYVPFVGKLEDRTRAPYGLVKGMIYLQDEVNARIARMQWGLGAVRTTRTEGAVMDDDDTFRDEVARSDADIVLDAQHMAQPGATFKVERDFELNRQQYDRLVDAREGIKRTGGIYNAFMGMEGQAQSGVAQAGLVEQSNQALAEINDNFKTARQAVGDLLLSLIIEDLGSREEVVVIDGRGVRPDKEVRLNVPQVDADGLEYLDNDVQRTKLKVTLDDVPSTPSFRAQQLMVMSEAFKSAPQEYQRVLMPFLFNLLDIPEKDAVLKSINDMATIPTEEEITQRIDQAVQDALAKERMNLKARELDQKQPLVDAQVKKTINEAVNKSIEAYFGAIQTGQTIAAIPQTAVLADTLLNSAGAVDHDAAPIVPMGAPVLGAMPAQEGRPAELNPAQVEAIQRQAPASAGELLGRRRNTSPNFPTNPAMPANPDVGVNAGIEGGQG